MSENGVKRRTRVDELYTLVVRSDLSLKIPEKEHDRGQSRIISPRRKESNLRFNISETTRARRPGVGSRFVDKSLDESSFVVDTFSNNLESFDSSSFLENGRCERTH